MGAGREPQAGHGLFQELLAGPVKPAMVFHVSGFELGIGKQILGGIPVRLNMPGIGHAFPNGIRAFGRLIMPQVRHGNRGHFHVNVQPVPERARQPARYRRIW